MLGYWLGWKKVLRDLISIPSGCLKNPWVKKNIFCHLNFFFHFDIAYTQPFHANPPTLTCCSGASRRHTDTSNETKKSGKKISIPNIGWGIRGQLNDIYTLVCKCSVIVSSNHYPSYTRCLRKKLFHFFVDF